MDIKEISSGLVLGEDGIWRSKVATEVSFPADAHARLSQVEDESFWFRHRNQCIEALIRNHAPSSGGPIFDIGGGNGCVTMGIQEAGWKAVLVEPGRDGILNAQKRGIKHLIHASLESAQFDQESLPAVGLFDVVEHIDDDRAFMQKIHSVLIPGGRVYLTVPAYSYLWSTEDEEAGHFRRYTINSVSQLLIESGFQIEFATYIFRILPLPIFLFRALPFRLGIRRGEKSRRIRRDHGIKRGRIAKAIEKILAPEIKNIRTSRSMSFGGSCLVVAKREAMRVCNH